MSLERAAWFMFLLLVLLTALVCSGCQSQALQDFDRDYVGNYNASTGQGGLKVRWSPAAERGKGKPSVGLEIDFKQVVPPMDFTSGTGRSLSLQEGIPR